ncbi:MAG: right-handed parallel beta-helix repeat-containing protein [Planctomycetota bacterium]
MRRSNGWKSWCVSSLACLFLVGCTAAIGGQAWAQAGGDGQELGYDIAETGLTGRTWVVSPRGSDSADGTEADPLKTIQAAADRVNPGDTVLIRQGTYKNNDESDFAVAVLQRGGTAENWVRFANYPGETPVIEFNSLRGIMIQAADYLVVEGLEIDGRSDEVNPREAVAYAEAYDGTDFSQGRFFGVGIRVGTRDDKPGDFSHHLILRNNKIHHCSGGGIATARADYLLIENNEIFRCGLYSPWGESGISVWQSANHDHRRDVYRTVIKDNLCYQNDNFVKFWILDSFSDGNGIILDALQNTQSELIGGGQVDPYSGRILIVNNVCFLNGGRGVNVYESDNADIVHNTLLYNGQRDNIKNEIELGRAHHIRVFNNLIAVAPGKRAVGGYQSEDIAIDYNLIHGTKGTDFSTGDHSLAEPPGLRRMPPETISRRAKVVPLDRLDFRPDPRSAAVGAGTPEHVFPIDHAGKPRDPAGPVTVGAHVPAGSP